MSVLTKMGQT